MTAAIPKQLKELELELENPKCETREGRSQNADLAVKGSAYCYVLL